MPPQRIDVHVNPSDETIHLGPLAVRFLITGEDAEWQSRPRRAAAVIDAAAGGPPDRVKMADIMRRHGLTPAP